ncbi:hypothetical protein L7F22_034217 [Adiantum nelumboides]|nr:hypothetical protein [Adiantum nelumboides]
MDTLTPVVNYILEGEFPKDFTTGQRKKLIKQASTFLWLEGSLYRKGKDLVCRRVPSTNEIPKILKGLHEEACGGHFSHELTLKKVLLAGYVWPSMHADVQHWCRCCHNCQVNGNKRLLYGPRQAVIANGPFEKWGIDAMGPLPRTANGKLYILVAIDYMTRWVEAQSVAKVNEKTVSKFAYTHICCRFGTPLEIVSDNGPGFRRGLLTEVCEELKISHRHSTPYYPQSNGLVEKANRIIAGIIRKMVESRQEQNIHEAWIDRLLNLVELEWKREAAYHCYEKKALQLKDKFNEGIKDKQIKEKSLVLRYNNALDNRFDAKLERRWEGPFIVKKAFTGGYYQLMDLNGKEHPRKVNGYRLKPYLSRILPAVFETKQVSKKTKKEVAKNQKEKLSSPTSCLESSFQYDPADDEENKIEDEGDMSQATQQVLPTIDEETPFHKGDAMSTQEVVEHESDFVAQKPSNDMNKGSENMLPTIRATQIHEGNTRNSKEKMVLVENQSDVQTSPKPSDDMIIKDTYNMPLRNEEVEGSEKKDEANEEHQGALATTKVQDKVDKGTGKVTRNANKAQSVKGRVQGIEGAKKIDLAEPGEEPKPAYIAIDLTEEEEQLLIATLKQYKDVFAWSYKDLKGVDPSIGQHTIPLKSDAKPSRQRPYTYNETFARKIKEEIDKLKEAEFIYEIEHRDSVSPIVVVPKKIKKLRVCVNLKKETSPSSPIPTDIDKVEPHNSTSTTLPSQHTLTVHLDQAASSSHGRTRSLCEICEATSFSVVLTNETILEHPQEPLEDALPLYVLDALASSESKEWHAALLDELQALETVNTWELVPPPEHHNIVSYKWLLKKRYHADGSVDRYKARLAARGFTQQEGVDYFDTYFPILALEGQGNDLCESSRTPSRGLMTLKPFRAGQDESYPFPRHAQRYGAGKGARRGERQGTTKAGLSN